MCKPHPEPTTGKLTEGREPNKFSKQSRKNIIFVNVVFLFKYYLDYKKANNVLMVLVKQ